MNDIRQLVHESLNHYHSDILHDGMSCKWGKKCRLAYILSRIDSLDNILEIGAYKGWTTTIFLTLTAADWKSVIVVDSWNTPPSYTEDTFTEFKLNTLGLGQCRICREDSISETAKKFVTMYSPYTFALVDGAHDYTHAKSDINLCASLGIPLICVDDCCRDGTYPGDAPFEATREAAELFGYEHIIPPTNICENYLVKK